MSLRVLAHHLLITRDQQKQLALNVDELITKPVSEPSYWTNNTTTLSSLGEAFVHILPTDQTTTRGGEKGVELRPQGHLGLDKLSGGAQLGGSPPTPAHVQLALCYVLSFLMLLDLCAGRSVAHGKRAAAHRRTQIRNCGEELAVTGEHLVAICGARSLVTIAVASEDVLLHAQNLSPPQSLFDQVGIDGVCVWLEQKVGIRKVG